MEAVISPLAMLGEAANVGLVQIFVVLAYLFAVAYLGYLGYRGTKSDADYLVAGRKTHPFVMALSYGATFISTSAIVGFGGVAGLFGMSVLWLTVLNIFVGIFIAFVFLAPATRKMGHRLDAHTFPELLGSRYDSKFIQVVSGLIIFLFIPLYASAVMIGGCEFIATQLGIPYEVALLVFAIIIAAYVVVGGLKGVMYTDALQGSIMFVGMLILLIFTYVKVGGVVAGNEHLGSLADLVPGKLKAIGHQGWTAMPTFGWGDISYNLWWIVVSTITLGVGIGVLAQPQLTVRFMTVRSKRELNRAALVGGLFILVMTGVAFVVGSLSNSYFAQHGPLFKGRVVKMLETENHAVIQLMAQDEQGQWADVQDKMLPVVIYPDQRTETTTIDGNEVTVVQGRTISIVMAKGNLEQIIPTYLSEAMPKWFGLLFLLTLLAAAMSTLSSQFHAVGSSIGRDVYMRLSNNKGSSIAITRIGVVAGILIAVVLSYYARGSMWIARATAIFFGLCASAFLPAYLGGLFFKRVTRVAAIWSLIVGFLATAFWLTFVKSAEASAIGLVQKLTDGKTSILAGVPNWDVVDPICIALPLSILTLIIVSLVTKPNSPEHLDKCFK